MRIEKGKGIFLEPSEAKVIRNPERAYDQWDPDFQVVLRSAGSCARFFPHVTRQQGKNGAALFSLGANGEEYVSQSRPLRYNDLSRTEYGKLCQAMEDLHSRIAGDPEREQIYKSLRFPDPEAQPERWRIYGPFWHRRILLLWGYDSLDAQGVKKPVLTWEETRKKLQEYVDPMGTAKIFLGMFWHVLLTVAVLAALFFGYRFANRHVAAYRQQRAAIPRCQICSSRLENGLCPQICYNCAIHKPLEGPCLSCRQARNLQSAGIFSMAPLGVVDIGEDFQISSAQPGTFRSADWPSVHVDMGGKVFYRWNAPGNYQVSWTPDEGVNAAPVTLKISVRKRPSLGAGMGVSFLFLRKYDDSGKVEELSIKDCSFADGPGHSIVKREVRWSGEGQFAPLEELTDHRTARQLALAAGDAKRQVTLRVTDNLGEVAEMTRELFPDLRPAYPEKVGNTLEICPQRVVVGETVLCKTRFDGNLDWGDGRPPVPSGNAYANKAYARAGVYEIHNDGGQTAKVEVFDLRDERERILDLSPPSIQIGNEVAARDVSGLKEEEIVRRDIRWGKGRPFEQMQRHFAVESFGKPGVYEVTMRLWKQDGTYLEETRNVKVVHDDWKVVLAISPNPASIGEEIEVRDLSVVPPGYDVVERQIRWFPSREFVPMPGKLVRKSFAASGPRKAVVRLLDDHGEYHYAQAGVTIVAPEHVAPILSLSSQKITAGQSIWFADGSVRGQCETVERRFRKDISADFEPMTDTSLLVSYDKPGLYRPEMRVTCKCGLIHAVEREIRVLEKPEPLEENPDFMAERISVGPARNGKELKLVYQVRQRPQSALDVDTYHVTYFSVGGNKPVSAENGQFVFECRPGGVQDVVLDVEYCLKNGVRGAVELCLPPISPEIKLP